MWSMASTTASQCGLAAFTVSCGCSQGLGSGAGQGDRPCSSVASPLEEKAAAAVCLASPSSICCTQDSGLGASGLAPQTLPHPEFETPPQPAVLSLYSAHGQAVEVGPEDAEGRPNAPPTPHNCGPHPRAASGTVKLAAADTGMLAGPIPPRRQATGRIQTLGAMTAEARGRQSCHARLPHQPPA